MAYQVLARKWRPRNFHEVMGQQHVLQALANALDQGRLHHTHHGHVIAVVLHFKCGVLYCF